MNKKLYKFCVSLVRPILKILFPYEVRGAENLESISGGYVVCSNHLSNVDPIFLAVIHPHPISFMAKDELFKNKLFGKFLRAVGVFPVKRGRGDKTALETSEQVLKSGDVLGIFIEGTRSKTGDFLKPRSGAAFIAAKAASRVLPVCITGSGENGKIEIFKKTVISYGEAIAPEMISCESRLELKDSTNLIMNSIKKLRGKEDENSSC